jgi:hypothetical protein
MWTGFVVREYYICQGGLVADVQLCPMTDFANWTSLFCRQPCAELRKRRFISDGDTLDHGKCLYLLTSKSHSKNIIDGMDELWGLMPEPFKA